MLCLIAGLLASLPGCSAFPMLDDTSNGSSNASNVDMKALQAKADEFLARYKAQMDETLSYQEDPDFGKAEEKRQKLIAEANLLAAQFQDLSDKLQSRLGGSAGDKPFSSPTATTGVGGMMDIKGFRNWTEDFQVKHTGMLDDMLSYQEDPDLDKAEQKLAKLVYDANSLASQFQEMADNLQNKVGTEANASAAKAPGANMVDAKSFKQKADEAQSRYRGLVEDMLSYEADPDLNRLETNRQKLNSEADSLADKFKELARKLQHMLRIGDKPAETGQAPAK